MEEDGFYRLDGTDFQFAPNGVMAPEYILDRSSRATYTYPIGGWRWFDFDADARAFFGIAPIEQIAPS